MNKRRNFEEWEKDFICLSYPLFSNPDIASVINRSVSSIEKIAARYNHRKYNKIPKIKEKFNRLIVLNKIEKRNKHGKILWNCECSCGNTVNVLGTTLIHGRVNSCGCLRSDISKTKEYDLISGNMFGDIKINAEKRNIDFKIDIKYINDLLRKQDLKCLLSDIKLNIHLGRKTTQITASLDRIDNNKGYIENNLRWLYKTINIIKLDFTDDEFLKYCYLCTHPIIEIKNIDINNIDKNKIKNYLKTIYYRLKNKKLSINIDENDIIEKYINQNGKCSLTGLDIYFDKISTASIDRINSLQGYIKENIQILHKDINYMKWKLDQTYFLNLCKKIYEHNKDKIDESNKIYT